MLRVWRLLPVGLVIATAGCVGWRRADLPGPAPGAPLRLGAAFVTNVQGYTVELNSVVVSADSVVGWRAREPRAGERLALHRSEVRNVSGQTFSFGLTALAVAGFAAVAGLASVAQGF